MNLEDDLDQADPLDRDLRRALRAASGPERDSAAADRLATAAWEMRCASTNPVAPVPTFPPRFTRSFPWRRAWVAAVAAGLLAALLVPRVHGEALAVEGAPVKVWGPTGWTAGRSVPAGGWVLTPSEVTTLRAPGGALLHPGPGSLFRFMPDGKGEFAVEVLRGRVHMEGEGVEAEAGALRIEPMPGAGPASFTVRLGRASETTATKDDASSLQGWTGLAFDQQEPGVVVGRGSVRVRLFASGDAMVLRASEEVSAVEPEAGAPQRLALNRPFHGAMLEGILSGRPVLGAKGDGEDGVSLLLQDDSRCLLRVRVAREERDEVLLQVNEAMFLLATRLQGTPNHERTFVTMKSIPPGTIREFRHRKDGEETRLLDLGRAGVVVQRNERETIFDGLPAARRAHPEIDVLFGDHLPK